jgi:hypothetical protein
LEVLDVTIIIFWHQHFFLTPPFSKYHPYTFFLAPSFAGIILTPSFFVFDIAIFANDVRMFVSNTVVPWPSSDTNQQSTAVDAIEITNLTVKPPSRKQVPPLPSPMPSISRL